MIVNEYLKTGKALLSNKIHFSPKLSKKAHIGPKIILFGFFQKFINNLKSLSWKWSKMKANIFDISPPIP